MARSASVDPVERFRFKISILNVQPAIFSPDVSEDSFARAGFSEVTLPKISVKTIKYRENIDSTRFTKIPGLVEYEDITFRRGVTSNRDLYNWYKQINNDVNSLNTANELLGKQNIIPVSLDNFRKDIKLEVMDRAGNTVKQWVLFNCYPVSYNAGNGLDAKAEEKLIEELTIAFEAFIELEGGDSIASAFDESKKQAAKTAGAALAGYVLKGGTL